MPIEHIWDMIKQELTQKAATNIAELQQQVQDAWENLLQEQVNVRLAVDCHLYAHLPVLLPERGTLCIDANVWAPLTMIYVSFGPNSLLYTPTMINILSYDLTIK